jgi:PAS domain-containing protein
VHDHPELKDAAYVAFVDSSRRYVDCSDGVCQLLGYERGELLRKTIDDISYHGEDVGILFGRYVRLGGLEGEYVLQHKDRTPVPIHYKAFVFNDGCHAAIWEPIHDWRELYMSAVLEVDRTKLNRKVEIALAAVHARLLSGSQTEGEKQLLRDAVATLRTLRKL